MKTFSGFFVSCVFRWEKFSAAAAAAPETVSLLPGAFVLFSIEMFFF